jgi:hypothetical protein
MSTEQKVPAKRVSDLLGDGHISFHPELERMPIRELVNHDLVLEEIMPMRGWSGEFGSRDWYLLKISLDGVSFTTKIGGVAVNKRLEDLLRRKALPITAKFVLEGEGDRVYFNVI